MKKSKKEKRDKNAQITHESAPTVQTPAAELIAPPTPTQAPQTPELDIWQKNINQFTKDWDFYTKEARAVSKPVQVSEAYRTRNGDVYFQYADLGRIPVARSLELNKQLLKLRFCITPEYMRDLETQATEAIAAGNTAKAMQLFKELFDRNKVAPEVPTMLELAVLFFVRHDENPYIHNPITHQQKIKAAEKDYNLQAFFLDASWQIMQQTDKALLQIWKIGNETAFRDYLQGKVPTRKTN